MFSFYTLSSIHILQLIQNQQQLSSVWSSYFVNMFEWNRIQHRKILTVFELTVNIFNISKFKWCSFLPHVFEMKVEYKNISNHGFTVSSSLVIWQWKSFHIFYLKYIQIKQIKWRLWGQFKNDNCGHIVCIFLQWDLSWESEIGKWMR